MAHTANMSALTDELIESILAFDPTTNKRAYKHAKELASRQLRGHQYARTNQFDITATLDGLDEKFRVKNREDLADALRLRLRRLDGVTNKFTPDVLSLLLQLSDRPLENTRIGALELLRPPSPPQPLTWDQILEEDPYSDEDIWNDIDYAVASSDDEQTPRKREHPRTSPPNSTDDDNVIDPGPNICVVNSTHVKSLETAQYWGTTTDDESSLVDITELQIIRETLFMLAGLQTTLFPMDKEQNTIRSNPRYTLPHVMSGTMSSLLSELVSTGRQTYRLRQWTRLSPPMPIIQTLQAAIRTRMASYDSALAGMQRRYLTPSKPLSVSLMELYHEVRLKSVPLLRLSQIVHDIEATLLVNPFSHLEALFDQVTLAQLTLDTEGFHYFSDIFFECLQTYLKPIRLWMEAGELGLNDETFFVFQHDTGGERNSLWHDRYVLRRDVGNGLRCPSFLQPAVQRIFNTGKSVVFLKELGIYRNGADLNDSELRLESLSVCGPTDEVPLSPFPQLFRAAFDKWMARNYSQASSTLRQYILEVDGLMRTLEIFEILYLGKNGAMLQNFANIVFERMDLDRKAWNDRYVLTEVARAVFASAFHLSDAKQVIVRSPKIRSDPRSVKALAGITIDFALAWPTQNILQRTSMLVYQQVFTFLLQTYRAKYLLQRTWAARTSHANRLETQLRRKLNHRLIWFADILRSYLTETVIMLTTEAMHAAMDKAEDLDEMSQVHLDYVAKLRERAMLSKDLHLIHKAIMEVLDLCGLLSESVSPKDNDKVPHKKNGGSRLRGENNAALSDLEEDDDDGKEPEALASRTIIQRSQKEILQKIDSDFSRLLAFITAGLRSVGRAGAEPMWEQLAERLTWETRKHLDTDS